MKEAPDTTRITLVVDMPGRAMLSRTLEQLDLFLDVLRGFSGEVARDGVKRVVAFEVEHLSQASPLECSVVPINSLARRPAPLKRTSTAIASAFLDIKKGRRASNIGNQALRQLSDLTRGFSQTNARAAIVIGETRIELDESLANVADRLVGGYELGHGTVTGRLEAMNLHGRSNSFRIYSEIQPQKLSCKFPKRLRAKVIKCIDEIVEVSGQLRYRSQEPFPFEILAESVDVIPAAPDGGWLALAGAMDHEDVYSSAEVRANRDAD